MLEQLCAPALIYFIFSITQVIIDFSRGMYNMALVKLLTTFIITILLNYLCASGLDIISWFIVFIPFITMTLIVSILLYVFGLDPRSGKIDIVDKKLYQQMKSTDNYPEPRNIYTDDTSEKISKQRNAKTKDTSVQSAQSTQMSDSKYSYLFKDEDMSPLNRVLSAGEKASTQDVDNASEFVKKKVGSISQMEQNKNII